jgi:methyltransferase
MLGKKKSFIELKKYLIEIKNIQNISEAEFCQGHTIRWGLAWSLKDETLPCFKYMKVNILFFYTSCVSK